VEPLRGPIEEIIARNPEITFDDCMNELIRIGHPMTAVRSPKMRSLFADAQELLLGPQYRRIPGRPGDPPHA
jgi:hypothetical protein